MLITTDTPHAPLPTGRHHPLHESRHGERLGDLSLHAENRVLWPLFLAHSSLAAALGLPTVVILEDESAMTRRHACYALSQIGAPAVDPLIATLTDANPATRAAAAEVLNDLGPSANSAGPHLSRGLADPDADVRRRCAGRGSALPMRAARSTPTRARSSQ